MNITAIYFDFDGTIADTSPAIVETMQRAYRHFGLEAPSPEAIRQTIGLPLEECCRIAGGVDAGLAVELASYYRSIFNDYIIDFTALFPGVKETLSSLHARGLRLAICTSRGAPSLDLILKAHGIAGLFETRVTAVDGLEPKPSPHMVLTLLERMGLGPQEVMVVGDTTFDILMGSAAGCRTCAVTYGNHSREKLLSSQPDWVIDSFEDLPGII